MGYINGDLAGLYGARPHLPSPFNRQGLPCGDQTSRYTHLHHE